MALDVVTRALRRLRTIDDLQGGLSSLGQAFEVLRVLSYPDGVHDLVATRAGGGFSFGLICDCAGRIRVITLWDHPPRPEAQLLAWVSWQHRNGRWTPASPKRCRFATHHDSRSPIPTVPA